MAQNRNIRKRANEAVEGAANKRRKENHTELRRRMQSASPLSDVEISADSLSPAVCRDVQPYRPKLMLYSSGRLYPPLSTAVLTSRLRR